MSCIKNVIPAVAKLNAGISSIRIPPTPIINKGALKILLHPLLVREGWGGIEKQQMKRP